VISLPVKIESGKAWTATKRGKMRQTIVQKNGDTVDVTLIDVKFICMHFGLTFTVLGRVCKTVSTLETKD
jgi:hypothetical protein